MALQTEWLAWGLYSSALIVSGGMGNTRCIVVGVCSCTWISTSSGSEQIRMKPRANIPHLNGAAAGLKEHQEAIAGGFEAMYRFLMGQREPLLAPDGPLAVF